MKQGEHDQHIYEEENIYGSNELKELIKNKK